MTIKELAQLAGVSISTVSKIMNHKDASISAETRERVLRIAKEFNYSPYSSTINSGGKTFTIGVLLRSSGANLSLNGIIEAARILGYTVLVSESAGSPEAEFKGITALCRHNVDGVLWEPVNGESLKYAESFKASGIPLLLFNFSGSETSYNLDYEQMAYEATMAMVRSHHTDIACLLSPGARTEGVLNGYKRCLFDMGIPYQENLVFQEITEALLHKITGHAITGIINSHFVTAIRLYRDLISLHYQIPYDVSLISLRNDSREVTDFPQISTFTIPHFRFGQHLCNQLVHMIEHPDTALLPFEDEPILDNCSTIDIPFTHRTSPLVVVGSINIDNYLKVNHLPTTGKTTITSTSSVYPGGKGINQAIGAAKLGARVALIGNVGNDVDSDMIYGALRDYSVDASGVRRCGDASTGKAYIFVQKDGDSMISILSGANSSLSPEDIKRNERSFENCRYCLVQTEIPDEAVLAACRIARKHGAKTILKPSTSQSLDSELLKHIDLLVPNYNEICELCPDGTLGEKAGYFLKQGVETVIITLGPDGCYVKTKNFEEQFPAARFQPIDNTGAGDAFICALAVYLQNGYSLVKAVRIATYAAGFSITREGVSNALIDKSTLESYLSQEEPDLLKR